MHPVPGAPGRAWLFSVSAHGIALAAFFAYALFAPEPPPVVAVFELVSAERPKLRPIAPKTPETPPEKSPESRPPEAPAPTPKPKPKPNRPTPAKPEPKVVRPVLPDTTLPVKDVARENASLTTTLVANLPTDPRLAFWAGRAKKMVESRWNPPAGIDVPRRVKTVVSFEVARSGEITSVTVTAGSGNALLDDLAKRTIQRVERVAPIPENFPGDLLKVSYEFIYNGD